MLFVLFVDSIVGLYSLPSKNLEAKQKKLTISIFFFFFFLIILANNVFRIIRASSINVRVSVLDKALWRIK